MVRTTLPSERARFSQAERTRRQHRVRDSALRLKQTGHAQRHALWERNPPAWMQGAQLLDSRIKGVQRIHSKKGTRVVRTRGTPIEEYEKWLREEKSSTEPNTKKAIADRRKMAEKKLFDHFNRRIMTTIKRYFELVPDSPHPFNDIYYSLFRQFHYFLERAREKGIRNAMYGLNRGVFYRLNQPQLVVFERVIRKEAAMHDFGRGGTSPQLVSPNVLDCMPEKKYNSISEKMDFEELLGSAGLKEREKNVLRLYFKDGLSNADIGNILRLDRATVFSIKSRALRSLKEKLERKR